jgi:hypothetical protein
MAVKCLYDMQSFHGIWLNSLNKMSLHIIFPDEIFEQYKKTNNELMMQLINAAVPILCCGSNRYVYFMT